MLSDQIKLAIASTKDAVRQGGLAFRAQLVERGPAQHVPGSTPVYPETLHNVVVVRSAFASKEIDGERVRADDERYIVFAETGQPIPEPNHLLRISGLNFRIISNAKVSLGSEVVLSQVHVRTL